MEILILIILAFIISNIISNIFLSSENKKRKEAEKLPSFTKKEAENYYNNNYKKLSNMANVIMKFKDAPIGARFHFIGDDSPKDVYVKIHDYDKGLIVQWNGNVEGHQSACCWLDEENGYDFDTEIELI